MTMTQLFFYFPCYIICYLMIYKYFYSKKILLLLQKNTIQKLHFLSCLHKFIFAFLLFAYLPHFLPFQLLQLIRICPSISESIFLMKKMMRKVGGRNIISLSKYITDYIAGKDFAVLKFCFQIVLLFGKLKMLQNLFLFRMCCVSYQKQIIS